MSRLIKIVKLAFISVIAIFVSLSYVSTLADRKTANLDSDETHAWSGVINALSLNTCYYDGSVKSSSKHECAFGLYCNDTVNGTFDYCGRVYRQVVNPGGSCVSRVYSGKRHYKVKIAAGGDLIQDVQKHCIATATGYGN